MVDEGGELSIVAPELKWNVKKAIEAVASLIKDTPDCQLLILAVLLLWARKYGSAAWQEYCSALLPPHRELSCLLCYTPGELRALQLPHFVDEAARQHDWARWAHTTWISSASGALKRLGLADDPRDTAWALAVVRSRAVEFPLGAISGPGRPTGGVAAGGQSGAARGEGPAMSVLAPVIDLANHSPDPNCVIQLTPDQSRVVLLPRRPIRAGEPLTVDYGFNRSSLELMADYGFVTTANPHDGWVGVPGADKLPPLELPRLQAAARALLKRHQRVQRQSRSRALPPGADLRKAAGAEPRAGEAEAAGDDEEEHEAAEEGEEEEADEEGVLSLHDSEADADASFSGRLNAAVALLAPRYAPGGPGSFSTPATQRIIAGLWHKHLRHTADSLPTSLEQDRLLLLDIEAGRVSGFAAGPALGVDPGSLPEAREALGRQAVVDAGADATDSRGGGGGGEPPSQRVEAPHGSAGGHASADRVGPVAAGPADTGSGQAVDATSSAPQVATDSSNAGDTSAPSASAIAAGEVPGAAPTARCRTGRRAGRLYAAVRARIEHKELLLVAEQLLLQYGR